MIFNLANYDAEDLNNFDYSIFNEEQLEELRTSVDYIEKSERESRMKVSVGYGTEIIKNANALENKTINHWKEMVDNFSGNTATINTWAKLDAKGTL